MATKIRYDGEYEISECVSAGDVIVSIYKIKGTGIIHRHDGPAVHYHNEDIMLWYHNGTNYTTIAYDLIQNGLVPGSIEWEFTLNILGIS